MSSNISFIINCNIVNWNTLEMSLCDEGIGPIQPLRKADEYIIEVTSDNTYVNDEITIMIATLSVEYNQWITVINSEDVVKSICPNDQCCQDIFGCFYFPAENTTSQFSKNGYLCAYNRNHSIPLCGSCDDGYAEIFNSPNCERCDVDHWEYFFFPIVVAFMVVFLLILCDTSTNDNAQGVFHTAINDNPSDDRNQFQQHIDKTRLIQDETEGLLVLTVRVFILFYQSINYILWMSGYTFWGTFVIQVLALDSYVWFWFFDYYPEGICFLSNLTAMQYHISYIYFPVCLMFALMIYTIVKKTCCKKCCDSSTEDKKEHTYCQFGGYTTWNVALIALFPILIVFFIMLSCKSINGYGSVHFYASYLTCYEIPFFVALALLIMIIVFFAYICGMLKRMDPNSCKNTFWKQKSYFFKGIARPYIPKFWYFEFMLILRRLCIILFITFQYFHKTAMHITLLLILTIFWFFEYKCAPFKYKRAFHTDLICAAAVIICLIIIIANISNDFYYQQASNKNNIIYTNSAIGNVNDINVSDMGPNQIATVTSMSIIVIIAPILLFLWYISWAIWSCCAIQKSQGNLNDLTGALKKRYTSMQTRLSMEDDKPNSPLNHGYGMIAAQSSLKRKIIDHDHTEYTEDSTQTHGLASLKASTPTLGSKVKSLLSSNKEYEPIYHDKSEDLDFEADDRTIDDSITSSNTFSTHHASSELEMTTKPNKSLPKQRPIPLSFSKNKLTVIEETKSEGPEESKSKENSNSFVRKRNVNKTATFKTAQSLSEKSRTMQSSGYDGTYSSVHKVGVTVGVTDMGRERDKKDDDVTLADSHFSFTKTAGDQYPKSDDDVTVNDEPNADAIQRIETESDNMMEAKQVEDEDNQSDNDGSNIVLDPSVISNENTARSQTQPEQPQKTVIPGTNEFFNDNEQRQNQSLTRVTYSSVKDLTPESKHPIDDNNITTDGIDSKIDDDTSGSDQDMDHDDKLEEMVQEILSTANEIETKGDTNESVSKPLLAPDHATDTDEDNNTSSDRDIVGNNNHDDDDKKEEIDANCHKHKLSDSNDDDFKAKPPETPVKKIENNMSNLSPPTEGKRDVSIASDNSDNNVTDGMSFNTTPLQHSRNQSASIMSVMSESEIVFTPAKSIGYSNASALKLKDDNEYKYEMVHHSAENDNKRKKNKGRLLKTATPKNIAIGFSKTKSHSTTLEPIQSHETLPGTIDNDDDSKQEKGKHKTQFVRKSKLKPTTERRGNMMSPGMDNNQTARFAIRQHSITSIGSKQSKNKPFMRSKTKDSDDNKENIKSKMDESKSESDSGSSTESESYSSTSIDTEEEKRSWDEYENNLQKLFFCLCTETNGKYMTLGELKRFLDIVELTKWWTMDKVLKVMGKNDNNKIILNEFISFFCNKDCAYELNRVSALKKHIEKQISWTLLLKSLDIFDKIDTNHSGCLDRDEFKEFGKMLKLSDEETEILWNKINIDKTGKITMVQIFEWFKRRLEEAKQKKKPKKNTAASEWSRSHSSFDDESEDTQSIQTETNYSNDEY